MPLCVPNFPPHYGSMMPYFSQTPHLSSTPTDDENVSNTVATEFSTQISLGGMSDVNEIIPNAHDQLILAVKALHIPVIKIWCYLVMNYIWYIQYCLQKPGKKHIGVKFLSTVMSIAHLILLVVELCA